MELLRVTKQPLQKHQAATLQQHCIYIHHISPTLLSAVTAFKIAKAADKGEIHLVAVNTQADALAALSARKITRNKDFKIICIIEPNIDCPRVIHKEIAQYVDGWIFSSERQYNIFPANLNNKALLPQASFTPAVEPPDTSTKPLTIAWIGDIVNTKKLKETIDQIDNAPEDVILRISGAGNARDVMPAVTYSRAMRHPQRVVWIGEEYNKKQEITNCQCAIRTNKDLTEIETEILMSGRPVIEPDEIPSIISAPRTVNVADRPDLNESINKFIQYYLSL